MGIFGGVKASEADLFAVYRNHGPWSTALAGNDAKKAREVIDAGFSFILHIHELWHIPQVCDSVITGNPIDVIDVADREMSMDVKPSKAMHLVVFVVNATRKIARFAECADLLSTLGVVAGANKANEYAGFRVVRKKFFKTLLSKHADLISVVKHLEGSWSGGEMTPLFAR